jgi:uncharacterized protein YndB with AHSA1/START domain
MATASMNPSAQISSDNEVVVAEVFIGAPAERVFQAITDPGQAALWWGQGDRYRITEIQMDLQTGGKWSAVGSSVNMGPIQIHGEILEVDPPRKLSYTWISSWFAKLTQVVWELETKDQGTHVKLTHTGFGGDAAQTKGHSTGWSLVLSWLQAFAEKGERVQDRG